MVVALTAKQRRELERLVARAAESAQVVRRVQVVLWSADGVTGAEIARRLQLSAEAVSRIRRRFLETGIAGLATRPKTGRTDHAVPAAMVERVIALAMSPPPAGRSRWTTRLLAKAVGRTSGCIFDLLRRHGLKPHHVRTYKVSRDPAFVTKVRDIVGLYLNPPEHAVVLSVDEKRPSRRWSARSHRSPSARAGPCGTPTTTKRHGVVDLYAALEVATGQVTHRLSATHTAVDFLAFMRKVVRTYPGRALHVILDNSSSHGTPDVRAWLVQHPEVHFHYTPTSASWLNQVEGLFGILGKQSLSVTDFHSKGALREHLAAYFRAWNRNPTPFAWTKPAQAIIRSHRRMLERISTAVH
jgi:transposase